MTYTDSFHAIFFFFSVVLSTSAIPTAWNSVVYRSAVEHARIRVYTHVRRWVQAERSPDPHVWFQRAVGPDTAHVWTWVISLGLTVCIALYFYQRSPGGERRRNRKRSTVSLETTRKGYRDLTSIWTRFKENTRETSDRLAERIWVFLIA